MDFPLQWEGLRVQKRSTLGSEDPSADAKHQKGMVSFETRTFRGRPPEARYVKVSLLKNIGNPTSIKTLSVNKLF